VSSWLPSFVQDYLRIIQGAQYFITRPFGVRAAVETAERLAIAIKAGDKREGEKAEPWQKLKYDRQIVAISLVEGATSIYSTDRDIHNQAKRWGGITPVSPADLPVPPKQHALPLPPAQPATQTGKPSQPTKTERAKKQ